MFKTITVGEHEVDFLATAATPIRFNQVFSGEDFYGIITSEKMSDSTGTIAITKLAYVMAMQARNSRAQNSREPEKLDFHALNNDTFVEWLEQFDPQDINDRLAEIAEVYMTSKKSVASPKK